MTYYRETYKDSKRWDGQEDLKNKKVIIYGEMGNGDQIQFLRFVRMLKEAMECHITIHAPKTLHRLISSLGVDVIDKDDNRLPEHDFHILIMDLPFLLKCPIYINSYISVPEKTELPPGKNIGIAWEGSACHEFNNQRNCPLKHFKALSKGVNLICLQPSIFDRKLVEGCEDMDLHGVDLEDFYDTAKVINSLDLVVSVDTAVIHLAGAMGKRGYVLLNPEWCDPRWQYPWYHSIRVLKGSWEEVFDKVKI